mmetsp:Transcript_15825/g.22514  ORF Transcript_15825/g.22514 Transcript_15825/m.22514 type:complete len:351 (-) Transcript_15825:122-1174(-)
MLRGILRNVQYLFLFFSVLLVFLALQKLQYLPPANAADFDKPDYELKSSIYYRGDEIREIGWRSFRVGVFKFILPSFSSSSSSSSRSENKDYYLTVPPPNDRPKSVAYIVDLSTRQSAIDFRTIAAARRLAKSIQRMHSDSKYDYKLYCTIINSTALLSSPSSSDVNDDNDDTAKKLSKLGFEIIDSTVYSDGDINSTRDEAAGSNHSKMYKIWKRHNVIISLSGIELHSSWNLDSLFDILLSKKNIRFPGVDSFLLQPHQSYARGREEILIFNGSSHRAFETCREFLSCVTADRPVLNEIDKEAEESSEANVSGLCIDKIHSNRGLAICTYHQDFIDCSESMSTKKDTT